MWCVCLWFSLPSTKIQWVFSALYTESLQLLINLLCLDKIFTQIFFSGYGDVSCQTVLGKMFLVLFLLVGLVGALIHFIPWLLLKSWVYVHITLLLQDNIKMYVLSKTNFSPFGFYFVPNIQNQTLYPISGLICWQHSRNH